LTELEAEFEKVSSTRAVPTRYLRSQQQRQQRVDETDGAGEDDGMFCMT
jgi:cytoskeleton-associated protein 5